MSVKNVIFWFGVFRKLFKNQISALSRGWTRDLPISSWHGLATAELGKSEPLNLIYVIALAPQQKLLKCVLALLLGVSLKLLLS